MPAGSARDEGALVIFGLEGAEVCAVHDARTVFEGRLGEARATFCIGVPCEKLVPKIS